MVPKGPMFLKTIIRTSMVDTRSTVFHIRYNLNLLDTYMATVTYNIEFFKQYVKCQTEALSARGETSSDLLINLFSALSQIRNLWSRSKDRRTSSTTERTSQSRR
jgi:hypothetical protein